MPNADAQFSQGMTLARAPKSAADWAKAVALIESAAESEHAEAAERAALFAWMRARTTAERERALDRLQQAAQLGCDSARDQLLLLADATEDVAAPDWTDVRGRINIERLLSPPVGQTVTEQPFVGVIEHFVSPAECRWLIEHARGWLDPSTIHDPLTGDLRLDPRRTNKSAMIGVDRADLVIEVIRTRISAMLGLPLEHFEGSQVMRYAPGEEFKPHHDYFDPAMEGFRGVLGQAGQRVATLLIYLNDDFEGGETQFPSLGFNYRGRTGDAIAFSSVDPEGNPDPRTLHAGLPPTSGEKWIFSQWVRDRVAEPGAG